jgi:hypothetical protein
MGDSMSRHGFRGLWIAAIAARVLTLPVGAHAECLSTALPLGCVERPTVSSGSRSSGGSHRSESSSRNDGPTTSGYEIKREQADAKAGRFRNEADTALAAGNYKLAIDLYDKALDAHYTSANDSKYETLKSAARQAWLNSQWVLVEQAARQGRDKDLPKLLDAVQRIWYTDKLQESINKIQRSLADQRAAANRALKEARVVKVHQEEQVRTSDVYDTKDKGTTPGALVVVADPKGTPVGQLAAAIGLNIDLNKPENNDVARALSEVEYMLRYNQRAAKMGERDSAFKTDPKQYRDTVDKLNESLKAHGVKPVKPEEVEKTYESYHHDLTVAGSNKKGGGQRE